MTALRCALCVLLRLLAPVLPFVCEEAWSWWMPGSVHRASWPVVETLWSEALPSEGAAEAAVSRPDAIALAAQRADGAGLDAAASAIGAIRKAKSEARLAQKEDVALLIVRGARRELDVLSSVLSDVVAAGHVRCVELQTDDEAGAVSYSVTF